MSSFIIVRSLSIMMTCIFWFQSSQALSPEPSGSRDIFANGPNLLVKSLSQSETISPRTSKDSQNSESQITSTTLNKISNPSGSSLGSESIFSTPIRRNRRNIRWQSNSFTPKKGSDSKDSSSRPISSSSNRNNHWRDSPSRSNSVSSSDSLNWRESPSRSGSLSSGSDSLRGSPPRFGSLDPANRHNRREQSRRPKSWSGGEGACEKSDWRDCTVSPGATQFSNRFKTFTLAQSWGPGNILHLGSRPRESGSSEWTIHGLWPSRVIPGDHGDKPKDLRVTITLLSEKLKRFWPSYDSRFTDVGFWEYQYQRHAARAIGIESINTPYKYFEKTLVLFKKYDVGKILKHLRVLPGSRLSPKELRDEIRAVLGVDVQLICDRDEYGDQFMYEVRICFDEKFQLIDCAGKGENVCDDEEDALYPSETEHTNGDIMKNAV